MKTVLMFWDGAADEPRPELEGATPLALMRGGVCSQLAETGSTGWVDWSRLNFPMRSASTLALMLGVQEGFAAKAMRGPLEAVTVQPSDRFGFAYRVNLITSDGRSIEQNRVTECTVQETEALLDSLRKHPASRGVTWSGIGPGLAVLMTEARSDEMVPGVPPEVGASVSEEDESFPACWFRASAEVLEGHAVNDVRVDLGDNPANRVWLWGGGEPSEIRRAFLGAPLRARMVTNSRMAAGLGLQCSMQVAELGDLWSDLVVPEVPDAQTWGEWLAESELLAVYVESPGELGDYHGPMAKVKALDRMDIHVLKPMMDAVQASPEPVRVMLVSAPAEGRAEEIVQPVLLWGQGIERDKTTRWNEEACRGGSLQGVQPTRLVARLVGE
ncbi:MAG: hypothetical protein H7A43_01910 [Verrucomicrobia bacterium]|nr:hypothetical protein [Verrucomicrobiota bacterium]